MKRWWLLFVGFCFWGMDARAQGLELGAAANYVFVPAFDRALQTHNSTRPFIGTPQPLLEYGFRMDAGWMNATSSRWQRGVAAAYGFTRSRAENGGLLTRIPFHRLELGYRWRRGTENGVNGFTLGVAGTSVGSLIDRRQSTAADGQTERIARAWGIGAGAEIEVGYAVHSSGLIWMPFAAASLVPLHYTPNAEAVLNQTRGVVGGAWAAMYIGQIGLRIVRKPAQTR
jgi:hypothetical protein